MTEPHQDPSGCDPREATPRAALFGVLLGIALSLAAVAVGTGAVWPVAGVAAAAVVCRLNFARLGGRERTLESNFARSVASSAAAVALGVLLAQPCEITSLGPVGWAALALAGGLLGVAAAVPWRRYLLVRAALPFPEGAAAADLTKTRVGVISRVPLLVGSFFGAVLPLAVPHPGFGARLSSAFVAAGYFVGIRAAAALAVGSLGAWGIASLPGPMNSRQLPFVGAFALAGAGFGLLVRSLAAWWATTREPAPYRVRFELGGEGTRIEDMTPRADRDVTPLLRVLLVVAAILLVANATPASDLLLAVVGAAVAMVAVPMVGRAVGTVGTSVLPFAVVGTALAVILASVSVTHELGERTRIVALVVGVAVAVGGDLLQSFAAGSALGATPRRLALGAVLGAVAAAAVVWVAAGSGLQRIASVILGFNHLRFESLEVIGSGFGLMAAATFGVAALVGLPALSVGLGMLVPPAAAIAILGGGLVRALVGRSGDHAVARGVRFGGGLFLGQAVAGAILVSALPFLSRGLSLDLDALIPIAAAHLVVLLFLYHRIALGRAR